MNALIVYTNEKCSKLGLNENEKKNVNNVQKWKKFYLPILIAKLLHFVSNNEREG